MKREPSRSSVWSLASTRASGGLITCSGIRWMSGGLEKINLWSTLMQNTKQVDFFEQFSHMLLTSSVVHLTRSTSLHVANFAKPSSMLTQRMTMLG